MALCRGSTRSRPLWAAFPSTVQAFGQPGSPAALRLSQAPRGCLRGGGGLSEGGVAGLRLREPSLAWHLLWGTPCLWETQGASWMGQDPCQCPRHSRVSGLGKAVSGPWGQGALGARPVVVESLLLDHHRRQALGEPTPPLLLLKPRLGLGSDSSGTLRPFVLGPFFLLPIQQPRGSIVSRYSPFQGRKMSLPGTPGLPGNSNSALTQAPLPLLCEM